MRRFVFVGAAALVAAMLGVAAQPADAVTTPVLTTTRLGGPAVKVGAVLKSALAAGHKATFTTSLGTLTCASSSLRATVTKNPVSPATATASVTALTFGKCTSGITGVTVNSVSASKLPYGATISASTGHPVTVKEQSSTKPLTISATLSVGTSVTCVYTAASSIGHQSNVTHAVAFSKQKFTGAPGNNSLCPASGMFSATYGPVRDSSVTGTPAVFVN